MTNTTNERDNDYTPFLIVAILFTVVALAVDIWYSSFNTMGFWLLVAIVIIHCVLLLGWTLIIANYKDPNYDWLKKDLFWICVIIILLVGLNHATAKEDKQVIIDSQQNAAQQKMEDSLYKVKITPKKDSTK